MTVRLGEVSGVHPVPGPTLAVAWRSEQFVDEPLVCTRVLIGAERCDFFRRRRQASQIEINSANEHSPIRRGRLLEADRVQLRGYEVVDRIGDSRPWRDRGHAWHCWPCE